MWSWLQFSNFLFFFKFKTILSIPFWAFDYFPYFFSNCLAHFCTLMMCGVEIYLEGSFVYGMMILLLRFLKYMQWNNL